MIVTAPLLFCSCPTSATESQTTIRPEATLGGPTWMTANVFGERRNDPTRLGTVVELVLFEATAEYEAIPWNKGVE